MREFDSYKQKEFWVDMDKTFLMLSERDRYLLTYRYAWGMSSKEIAELMQIKEKMSTHT